MDIDTIFSNKIYDFSFIGELKMDRKIMIDTFKKNFDKKYISIGKTDWNNLNNVNIKTSDVYNIYQETYFIPIGRGNFSYDCFRFYEAIMSNAIPVIVGEINIIKKTYYFDGIQPMYIVAETWEEACKLCKNVVENIDYMKSIVEFNNKWWNSINDRIIQRIHTLINE